MVVGLVLAVAIGLVVAMPAAWTPDWLQGSARARVATVVSVAPPPDSSHVQVQEHRIDGTRVTEVVVGKAHIDDELPMVIVFHGRGDLPELPRGDHGEAMPLRMMFPWASSRLGKGRTWFPISITAGRDRALGEHIVQSASEVAELVTTLAALRPTEQKPLVTGFSQGGMMSMALAVLHPETVDSAYPVAGWLPTTILGHIDSEANHPPIRAVHGAEDPIVPLAPTELFIHGLLELGIDAAIEAFPSDRHRTTSAMRSRYRQLIFDRIRQRRAGTPSLG